MRLSIHCGNEDVLHECHVRLISLYALNVILPRYELGIDLEKNNVPCD